MKYVSYDATTGKILQWGLGEPLPDHPYLENTFDGELSGYCVVDGEIVEKPQMSLTLPATPTAADGVTEAVIGGLPAGTVAEFVVAGTRHSLVVEDGTLEIAMFDPVTLSVRFWHPTAQHDPVEVTFV